METAFNNTIDALYTREEIKNKAKVIKRTKPLESHFQSQLKFIMLIEPNIILMITEFVC
jgi:hypothetical protein